MAKRLMEESVILVNTRDEVLGCCEKMRAHREGHLHRAFSIFIFNSRGQLLLQRRAREKYHSGGLWSNTCCGHPRPGEGTSEGARRRLREEMGLDCRLKEAFAFTYSAELANGLREHEFDHVFVGRSDARLAPNPEEVCGWRWIDLAALESEMRKRPRAYTAWLHLCLERAPASLETF